MADIELRFHKDVLVLSAPLDATLACQGIDAIQDREFLDLLEPETLFEAAKLDALVGVQCQVTNTDGITRARLSHRRFEEQSGDIARASLDIVNGLNPQHTIAQIGPTLLPIDPESKASLKQSRDQYAQAVRDFGENGFDAILLNGMVSLIDLKCALMGARMVTDKPVMASVDVDAQGNLVGRNQSFAEAIAIMNDLGADVVGLTSAAPLAALIPQVEAAAAATDKPLLVQIAVGEHTERDLNPGFRPVVLSEDNPYRTPDALLEAAVRLVGAGAQFLRAAGSATASYSGALVIATEGLDCVR